MDMAQNNARELILHAAKNLFYENGYEKTTARLIADRTSMFHSNIFYYYPNKRSILKQVIRNFYQTIREQVEDLKLTLSPAELLLLYSSIQMKFVEMDEKFARLYYESTDVIIEVLYQDFIIHLYPQVDEKASEKSWEQSRKEYFMDLVVLLSSEKQLYQYRRNFWISISDEGMRQYFTKLNLKLLDIDDETIKRTQRIIDAYIHRIDFEALNIFKDNVIIPLIEDE